MAPGWGIRDVLARRWYVGATWANEDDAAAELGDMLAPYSLGDPWRARLWVVWYGGPGHIAAPMSIAVHNANSRVGEGVSTIDS
jgi:hypothetical protein